MTSSVSFPLLSNEKSSHHRNASDIKCLFVRAAIITNEYITLNIVYSLELELINVSGLSTDEG